MVGAAPPTLTHVNPNCEHRSSESTTAHLSTLCTRPPGAVGLLEFLPSGAELPTAVWWSGAFIVRNPAPAFVTSVMSQIRGRCTRTALVEGTDLCC